ncbi:MAG: LamG-like jellyroll fold domain-containing protein [Planctomycetota bacterium]
MSDVERDVLIEAFCTGTLDAAGARQLLAAVQDDPGCQGELVEQLRAHLAMVAAHAASAATVGTVMEGIAARSQSRPRLHYRLLAGVLAAMMLVGLALWAVIGAGAEPITVSDGSAVALADGQAVRGPLQHGQVLRAKGAVRLEGGDGTIVRVSAASVFAAPGADNVWQLHDGEFDVQADTPMQVRTPQAEATVLGTHFVLKHSSAGSCLRVEEGRVRFAALTGDAVEVDAGETASVRGGELVHSGAPALGELLRYQDYDAGRGVVIDAVGDLDLVATDASAVRALPGGGFVLERPTRLDARGTIGVLLPRLRAAGGMTIEAWVKPARLDLTGPSRIMTCSASRWNVNFVLGLGGDHPNEDFCWGWRLSVKDGEGGGRPTRTTKRGLMHEGWVHVVLTVAEGDEEILYIDGVPLRRQAVGAVFEAWSEDMRLRVGDEIGGKEPWERPYLGAIGLLSIRAGALAPEMVRHRWLAGRDRLDGGGG